MIGSVVVAIATIAVAAIIGCSSLGGGSRKANIATVIQTAYDLGGREAVSNKIESLPSLPLHFLKSAV